MGLEDYVNALAEKAGGMIAQSPPQASIEQIKRLARQYWLRGRSPNDLPPNLQLPVSREIDYLNRGDSTTPGGTLMASSR